jgi:hypothetical protein
MKLSKDLKCWRAERPDEWTMDRFIRGAEKLEQHASDLRKKVKQWRERSVAELENGKLLNRQAEYKMSSRAYTACADELDKLLNREGD